MTRTHGRYRQGERLRMGAPHGHWNTTTSVGALTLRGMITPFVISAPINRAAFETHVEKALIPELRPGDVVVMDNLSSHKGPRVRGLIEAAGAELMFLPPYSPDFNPIEHAFSKMKVCYARRRKGRSKVCGAQSAASSGGSRTVSVKTTSPQQDTTQNDRITP